MIPDETPADVIREVAGKPTHLAEVTLRDHFAAAALPPLLTFIWPPLDGTRASLDRVALTAYGMADSMLKARQS